MRRESLQRLNNEVSIIEIDLDVEWGTVIR